MASKYSFSQLQIGDSTFVLGKPSTIRSSASMWGRRYGIWLKCETRHDGCIVTRVEAPRNWVAQNKKIKLLNRKDSNFDARLKRVEDGVRFISVLLVQIKTLLEDK